MVVVEKDPQKTTDLRVRKGAQNEEDTKKRLDRDCKKASAH